MVFTCIVLILKFILCLLYILKRNKYKVFQDETEQIIFYFETLTLNVQQLDLFV